MISSLAAAVRCTAISSRAALVACQYGRRACGAGGAAVSPALLAGAIAATAALAGGDSFTARCESQQKALLTPEQQADVSQLVAESFSAPLVPASLQLALISRGVAALSTAIEEHTAAEDSAVAALLQEALDDGLTNARLEALCDKLAPALTRLPGVTAVLSAHQQRELLEFIVRALLSPECRRPVSIAVARRAADGLDRVLDADRRDATVTAIAARIDIPFLDEAAERRIIGLALGLVARALKARAVPRARPCGVGRALLVREPRRRATQISVLCLSLSLCLALWFSLSRSLSLSLARSRSRALSPSLSMIAAPHNERPRQPPPPRTRHVRARRPRFRSFGALRFVSSVALRSVSRDRVPGAPARRALGLVAGRDRRVTQGDSRLSVRRLRVFSCGSAIRSSRRDARHDTARDTTRRATRRDAQHDTTRDTIRRTTRHDVRHDDASI